MPASLRTLKATVQPDGVVRWLQPLELHAPAEGVMTVREPNATTIAAMQELAEKLPGFTSVARLFSNLDS